VYWEVRETVHLRLTMVFVSHFKMNRGIFRTLSLLRGHPQIDFGTLIVIMTLRGGVTVQPMTLYVYV